MAYFLTRTGQIAESDIEKTANRFYSEVQFTEEEASGLGITDITSLTSFDQFFSDSDYCIEIIKSGSSSLHYLLTYKKSGVLFSRDPADGKEYKRSEIQAAHPKYQFCKGGVFLKSYAG